MLTSSGIRSIMGPQGHEHTHENEGAWTGLFISAAILTAGLVAEFITHTELTPHLLYLVVMLYTGYPIAKSGVKALLNRSITMRAPMLNVFRSPSIRAASH
jgi:cation transport ATPase